MQPKNLCFTSNYFILFAGILIFTAQVIAAEGPQSFTSNDGTLTISWQSDFSNFTQFQIIDKYGQVQVSYPVIAEQGWVVSGLANGQYKVQLTHQHKNYLIGTVEVRHYSLKIAFILFALGALMFAYLVLTLIKQNGTRA
ncbi:hypothetical protein [Alteromonas sp. ASW11-130]|uniref:hypothetical protein n=1 Tax=Alteromonas sp. ASW11-130 TaxID=3015775 RepID=UPI00224266BC|nr:hypothetical protein [Alteromonas sp. ASW11-130]MCW8092356.1 hypothetical protein [Alteromonas sp. ASW11-130]